MKIFKILIIITVIIFSNNLLFGQCIANAGKDTALCDYETNEFQLGGKPTVIGGIEPYTYKWSANLNWSGIFTLTASDLLNDTTIANPKLKETVFGNVIITLEVIDGNNIACKDTINIYSPTWIITLDDKFREVQKNTPVELYTSVHSGSNILTYLWSPSIGLSNPNIVNPIAITDETRTYYLTITDSAGCQATDAFDVIINDTQISDIPNEIKKIKVIETDENIIFEMDVYNNNNLIFYTLNGVKIKEYKFRSNQLKLNKTDFKSGIYIFKILENNNPLKTGKIAIN